MGKPTCAAPDCDLPAKRKWCSKSCRMRVWHAEYRQRTGQHWSERAKFEKPCVDCGAIRRSAPASTDRPRERCVPCSARRAAERKSELARQRRLPVGPVPRRNSETARFIAAQSVKVKHPPLNGVVFVFGDCRWCGESFLALAGSWETRSLYCSTSCAGNAGKHRRGRFVIPATVRREIYERDGWVCQLCDDPVDPSLDSSDMWAATLDHIVPRSLQLVPDDSPSNLQLAHRWCNSVKGDGRYYDEEVLKVG